MAAIGVLSNDLDSADTDFVFVFEGDTPDKPASGLLLVDNEVIFADAWEVGDGNIEVDGSTLRGVRGSKAASHDNGTDVFAVIAAVPNSTGSFVIYIDEDGNAVAQICVNSDIPAPGGGGSLEVSAAGDGNDDVTGVTQLFLSGEFTTEQIEGGVVAVGLNQNGDALQVKRATINFTHDDLIALGDSPIRILDPNDGLAYMVIAASLAATVSAPIFSSGRFQIATDDDEFGTTLAWTNGVDTADLGQIITQFLMGTFGVVSGDSVSVPNSVFSPNGQGLIFKTLAGDDAPTNQGGVDSFTINNGGAGYEVGDTLLMYPDDGTEDDSALLTVTAVDGDGGITAADITRGGTLYHVGDDFQSHTTSGGGSAFDATITTINGLGNVQCVLDVLYYEVTLID